MASAALRSAEPEPAALPSAAPAASALPSIPAGPAAPGLPAGAGHRPGTGLLASVRGELLILRRRPAVWVLTLVLPVNMLIGFYVTQYVDYLSVNTPDGQIWGLNPQQLLTAMSPGQYLTGALSGFGNGYGNLGMYGAAVFMLLGALIGGGDWERGTIRVSLIQGPGRLAVALGQCLATVIVLTAGVIGTFAAAALASAIAAVGQVGSLSALTHGFPSAGQVASALGAGLLLAVAYGAIGLTFGVIFRSAAAGIGAVLVWFVVVVPALEYISAQLHGALLTLYQIFPDAATNTISSLPNHTGLLLGYPIYGARVAPLTAVLTLAAYAVCCLALPAFLTCRRDIA